jgi:DNA-binding transcriptional ArsR family regulator
MPGDVDVSVPAGLLADPARARLLMALTDGRSLPASVLAAEAGVSASTTSEHLAKLLAAGMLEVRPQGRHRYYRIADPRVVQAIEALAQLAPSTPIRSLRQGTRAEALRRSRLCYDHVAGRLGVALMASLIRTGAISGGDGHHHPDPAGSDRLSAPGHDVDYRLTSAGSDQLAAFGIDLDALAARRRPLVRYCMDWTEQAHHLAGGLGAAVTARLLELGWLQSMSIPRAVHLTPPGRDGMAARFGIVLDDEAAARPTRRIVPA